MKLTKQIRADLLNKLVAQAISKNIAPMTNMVTAINKAFWERERELVLNTFSGCTWEHVVEGMRLGMVTRTMSVNPHYQPNRESPSPWTYICYTELSSSLYHLIKTEPAWRTFAKHFYGYELGKKSHCLYFQLVTDESSPSRSQMGYLIEGDPMIAEIRKLQVELKKMLSAAEEFHVNCEALLEGVKTLRQLEDIFPEAAKLVEAPVVDKNLPMPIEFAKSVRMALTGGVPTPPAGGTVQ